MVYFYPMAQEILQATGKYAINILKDLIKKNLPIFGICLGPSNTSPYPWS
jgi:gamma-glutamyl-gamma-aminobutyrate hydrolase PuuD